LFLDGVISAPAFTGAMLAPYRISDGTVLASHWIAGTNRGPEVYFPPEALSSILIRLGKAGLDPHLHVDGDRAVRAGLDGIAALRQALPGVDIRCALAHDESVDPSDYPRFRQLNAIPVLSFQWARPSADMLVLENYFGPERFNRLEPEGALVQTGARIAFGSDWPVDHLNEWLAFEIGVTRLDPDRVATAPKRRLGKDPGLTRREVLRAATINAAYELHAEDSVGSLAPGKLADLIVLDHNPLAIPVEQIHQVQVLETVVGGETVYRSAGVSW
jgi:hypothetical protein